MRTLSFPLKRFAAGVLLLSLFGQGCSTAVDPAAVAATKPKEITIWGVIDDESVYDPMITDYRKLHPNVTVNYRNFRLEEYEGQLLNALAEDRGPDIFLIHNTWVGKYLPKISAMPTSVQNVVYQASGNSTVPVLQSQPTISIGMFKTNYPDAVGQDFVRTVNVSPKPDVLDNEQRIVALPMSVDTLGLYVNKDLLNAAGIATIPATWDAFQAAVRKLTKLDDSGNIVQAGAALGTSANVERAPDILSTLMMQNGAIMAADDGSPTFASIPPKLRGLRETPPAADALGFYTDFANPAKDVYTWNAQQPDALRAFEQGKLAFYFGYAYDLPTIKAQAPDLNLAIAQFPQIQGNPTVNFANYWGWTVSKKSKVADASWSLLNFMQQPEEVKKYLTAAERPAALKSLLPDQLQDENVGVFASQVLTSQSWYRGNDPVIADAAFNQLIDVASSTLTIEYPKILNEAADEVAQSFARGAQ